MAVERNNKNTEEQIKTACRYCVETYPKVEKQIRESNIQQFRRI